MPVCSGGSEPRTGTPAYIHIDPANLRQLLPGTMDWIFPFLSYIPAVDIEVAPFCALEPPSLPTITGEDLFNLITRNVPALAVAAGYKLAQLVHCYLWYTLCECTVTGPATPPTAPSNPGGLPAINPTTYVPPITFQPCATITGSWTGSAGGSSQNVIPPTNLPANWSNIRVSWYSVLDGASHVSLNTTMRLLDHNDAQLAIYSFNHTPPLSGLYHDFYYASGVAKVYITVQLAAGGPSTDDMFVTVDVYCDGGRPGQTVSPCCPPDPTLVAAITRIENLVTIIQRQAVPFAYVDGTPSGTLSGDGEWEVEQILGYRVSVVTVPDYVGLQAGTPETRWELGWIRTGYPDGWSARRFIDTELLVEAPVLASADRIGYSLNPGVEIVITPLLREP